MKNFPFVTDESETNPTYHNQEIKYTIKEHSQITYNKDNFKELKERAEILINERFHWILNGSWGYGNYFTAWQYIDTKDFEKLTLLYLSIEFSTPEYKIKICKDFKKWVELVKKESEDFVNQMWIEYTNFEASKKEG